MLAGIDLGGTQVRVALARSDGHLIASFKTSTPLLGSPQHVVEWAAAEIEKHRGREKVRTITIAAVRTPSFRVQEGGSVEETVSGSGWSSGVPQGPSRP